MQFYIKGENMTDQPGNLPTNPKRIKTFATFFKNYMSLSSLVVAALPIPVTSFSLIPTFKIQTRYFSVYTSLFCFLVLAYVSLARLMFRNVLETVGKPTKRIWSFCVNSLPPIFIILSLLCVYFYHGLLSYEISKIRPHLFYKHFNNLDGAPPSYKSALEKIVEYDEDRPRHGDIRLLSYETLTSETNFLVHNEWLCVHGGIYSSKDVLNLAEADMLGPYDTLYMILSYLGIFLFAAASFVLMAIKEYLQGVLVFGETKLIMTK